ncbi:MAG: bifunctional diaminohydroxyphosphoribosylaminopyrimidine deaminase/5-amino-6-(5-phosphoribosylamino)uracil reductase RibD [Planctomycetota bacterium]
MPDSSSPSVQADEHWMTQALELARRGRGRVEPNPMVGCVVVCDGREIGRGWHKRFGGPHAEVEALAGVSPEDIRKSDLFVTLEPCAHHGKTPPCSDLLVRMKPKRVVVAMLDPYPQVSGRGIAALRQAGIVVDVGVLESEARLLNAPYLKRIQSGLPWVIAKWAMTLDGAIASPEGDSKWITGEAARDRAHTLRALVDTIVVGSETVLRDDPLLTARPRVSQDVPRIASRVVIDRRLRIPVDAQLVRTADRVPMCIVTSGQAIEADAIKADSLRQRGVEILVYPEGQANNQLGWLLQSLCERGATNLLVEGGGKLLGAFFDGNWIDQVECFIAPKVLGSERAARPIAGESRRWISQARNLEGVSVEMCDSDLHVSGYLSPRSVAISG